MLIASQWTQDTYENIRQEMQPGDVIAFSGKKFTSDAIKWLTSSNVSHVGVVFQSKIVINDTPQPGILNQVAESTLSGVQFTRLSGMVDRHQEHNEQLWWLPLSSEARASLNLETFHNFLLHHEGRPYDFPQAGILGLDKLDPSEIIRNQENFEKLFCSELVAGALEAGSVINNINASRVAPIDLCRFNIYADHYVQFAGAPKYINWFNSVNPNGWGQ